MANRSTVLRAANLPTAILSKLSGGNAAANVGIVSTISDSAQKLAVKEAFAWSVRNIWIFYTCIAALGVLASFFIKRTTLSREVHVETKTGLREMEEKGLREGFELGNVA